MKNTTLGQLAPCMVAAMLACAAGPVSGQEIVGGTLEEPIIATPYDDFESEVMESAPIESAPMATSPVNPGPISSAPIPMIFSTLPWMVASVPARVKANIR